MEELNEYLFIMKKNNLNKFVKILQQFGNDVELTSETSFIINGTTVNLTQETATGVGWSHNYGNVYELLNILQYNQLLTGKIEFLYTTGMKKYHQS